MEENNKKSFKERILNLKEKAENNLKQEDEKKKNKIKFYKKFWFSTTKFDKYSEMAKEGAKSANKYLMIIVAIFAIMLSVLSAYEIDKQSKEGIEYIKKNLPEFTYKEGNIISENTQKIVLENRLIKEITGGELIIDTNTEDEEIINEYIKEVEDENKAVILLKNKVITVNWGENKTQEYSYQELLKQYAERNGAMQEITELSKEDIVSFVQTNTYSFAYYMAQYFITYFIIYFITFIIYVIILWIVGYLTSKILKLKIKIFEVYSLTIYSFTLPIILYIVYNFLYYFTNFKIPYFLEAYILIAYIYLLTALLNIRKNKQEQEGEN